MAVSDGKTTKDIKQVSTARTLLQLDPFCSPPSWHNVSANVHRIEDPWSRYLNVNAFSPALTDLLVPFLGGMASSASNKYVLLERSGHRG